jgi:hypothetical protein
MAGFIPAIHVSGSTARKDVDARDKPGHDDQQPHREAMNPVDSLGFLIRLRGRATLKDFTGKPSLVEARQT